MNWLIQQTAQLEHGRDAAARVRDAHPIAYPGDNDGHIWQVGVMKDGEPFDMTGHTIKAYFLREYDGESVMVDGTVNGYLCRARLPQEVYAYEGRVDGIMRATDDDGVKTTIAAVSFLVGRNMTEEVIDPGEVIPTIDDLTHQEERWELLATKAEALSALYGDTVLALEKDVFHENTDTAQYSWEIGSFSVSNGKQQNSTYFVRTTDFIYARAGSTINVDDTDIYKFQVCWYADADVDTFDKDAARSASASGAYTVAKTGYVRFAIARKDNQAQTDTGISAHFKLSIIGEKTVEGLREEVKMKVAPENIDWTIGQLSTVSGALSYAATNGPYYIASENFIRAAKGSTIAVDDTSAYIFNVILYSSASVDGFKGYKSASSEAYTVPEDCFIRIGIALKDTASRKALTETSMAEHFVLDIAQEARYKSDRQEQELHAHERSAFYRDVRYGRVPTEYYHGLQSDYGVFPTTGYDTEKGAGRDYKYEEHLKAWDALRDAHTDYITKADIGTSCDGQTICSYTLKSRYRWDRVDRQQPKVIIVSGQHGNEKCAPYGLYYFARDLAEKWKDNAILDYIHNHVELVIVPVANPSGFDAFTRRTTNGVNTNRNFDYNWTETDEDGYGKESGTAAFSEPETQAIRDLVKANLDACLLIDFHTQGWNYATNWEGLNWCSLCYDWFTDPMTKQLYKAACWHIPDISGHIAADYGVSPTTLCGTIDFGVNIGTRALTPTLKAWACSMGIPALTFEGFPSFPSGATGAGTCGEAAQKANSELIGNFLKNALGEFAKVTK